MPDPAKEIQKKLDGCSLELVYECPTNRCTNRIDMAMPDEYKLVPFQTYVCWECTKKQMKIVYMHVSIRERKKGPVNAG